MYICLMYLCTHFCHFISNLIVLLSTCSLREMGAMEHDLRLQTETFTDQLFQGRISDGEKVALEKWLKEQLEQVGVNSET